MRYLTLLILALGACSKPPQATTPLPDCEWCGSFDAPADLTHIATLVEPDEPGTHITLRGVIYQPDAVTPAPNVLLYAYNTDDTGVYRTDGTETGNARRHGQLRGWLRTDAQGRYEIRTIYPGGYPGRDEPSHVHITLTPPDAAEFWIDSTLFSNDSRLTDATRDAHAAEGRFSPIVTLDHSVGDRDITLLDADARRDRTYR